LLLHRGEVFRHGLEGDIVRHHIDRTPLLRLAQFPGSEESRTVVSVPGRFR
jgi:hypothetical protein